MGITTGMMINLAAATNWVKFFGHFHPLLVHLPVGFLVLLGLMELTGRFKKYSHITAARGFILVLLAVAALITVTCGWLLASGGGYNHRILFWHRWLGTSVAVLSLILLGVWLWRKKTGLVYYSVLVPALLVMAIAAHFGGSLTFGSRYLSKYAPPVLKPLLGDAAIPSTGSTVAVQPTVAATEAFYSVVSQSAQIQMRPIADVTGSFYNQFIQTAFTQDCIRCHGRDKQKGHLRLDSYRWLRRGSRGRPVVVPGVPNRSRLYRLISLPRWQHHHMPPRSHKQLTAGQIELIRWWIQKGASGTATLQSLHPPASIRKIIQTLPKSRQRDRTAPAGVKSQPIALAF